MKSLFLLFQKENKVVKRSKLKNVALKIKDFEWRARGKLA